MRGCAVDSRARPDDLAPRWIRAGLALGLGQRTVATPNVPATAGASVYAHYFVLDPPANALGITASNYVRLMAGF